MDENSVGWTYRIPYTIDKIYRYTYIPFSNDIKVPIRNGIWEKGEKDLHEA